MPIGDVCVRDVVIATKDVNIQQAAVLMDDITWVIWW